MSRSEEDASKCVLVGEGGLPRLSNIVWAEEFFCSDGSSEQPEEVRAQAMQAQALTYTMSLPGVSPVHGLRVGWKSNTAEEDSQMLANVESWQLQPVPIDEGEVGVRRVVVGGGDDVDTAHSHIELWDVQLKEVRKLLLSISEPLERQTECLLLKCKLGEGVGLRL